MKSAYEHSKLSDRLLDYSMPSVDRWKDEPIRWRGRYHREERYGIVSAVKAGQRFKGRGPFNYRASSCSIVHDLGDLHLPTIVAVGASLVALIWVMRKAYEAQSRKTCPICRAPLYQTNRAQVWLCVSCRHNIIF